MVCQVFDVTTCGEWFVAYCRCVLMLSIGFVASGCCLLCVRCVFVVVGGSVAVACCCLFADVCCLLVT